ncbi:MAG: hypothetical protein PHQ62_03105 [Clostridia bacterium]|nr:hypothetical protein [Clostridia bacterium]
MEKVRYQKPKIYAQKIDKKLVENSGIKLDKPLYVEKAKNINFDYAKSLWLAQKICPFSVVVFFENELSILAKKKFLSTAIFLKKSDLNITLKQNLLALNINIFEPLFFENIARNSLQILPSKNIETTFKNYSLQKTFLGKNFCLNIGQTFFNGKFYFFNNLIKYNKKIKIILKNIIKNNIFDYFLIKKIKFGYLFESVINKINYYFLSNKTIKNIKILPIKNSKNFCLIAEIFVDFSLPQNQNFVVYFGKENFDIFTENLQGKIVGFIEKKFALQLETQDKKLEFYFNKFLPKQIILDSISCKNFDFVLPQNFEEKNLTFNQIIDLYKSKKISSIFCYNLIKNKLFTERENLIILNKNELANYRLKLFFENSIKKINVSESKQIKLIINDISYYNCKSISLQTLKENSNFDLFM